MPYANNKGGDQPAHPHSLISAFVVRCLDSIMPLVSISEISSFFLASVAAQAGLSVTWSETPKTGFLVAGLILCCSTECLKRHELMSLVMRKTGLLDQVRLKPACSATEAS